MRKGSSLLWVTTLHKAPVQSPHSSCDNTVIITVCTTGNNFTHCTGGVLLSLYVASISNYSAGHPH